jgi:hypothetical protein
MFGSALWIRTVVDTIGMERRGEFQNVTVFERHSEAVQVVWIGPRSRNLRQDLWEGLRSPLVCLEGPRTTVPTPRCIWRAIFSMDTPAWRSGDANENGCRFSSADWPQIACFRFKLQDDVRKTVPSGLQKRANPRGPGGRTTQVGSQDRWLPPKCKTHPACANARAEQRSGP